MALSAERRTQLDGIVQQMAQQDAPQEDVQAIVEDFKKKYAGTPTSAGKKVEMDTGPKPPGYLEQTADVLSAGVNKAYEGFKGLPVVKQAGQGLGMAVGTTAAALTIPAAGLALPFQGLAASLQGQQFSPQEQLKKNIGMLPQKMKEQYAVGEQIGSEAAPAFLSGGLGKVATIPLAGSQLYQGYKDIHESFKSGDPVKGLTGSIELATGLLAGYHGAKGKGWLLNEDVMKPLGETKDRAVASLEQKAKGTALEGVPTAFGKPVDTFVKPLVKAKIEKMATGQYKQLLNMTPMQQQKELRFNKNTPEFLAKEGVILDSGPGGRLDTVDAREALAVKAAAENTAFDAMLKDSGEYVSIDEYGRKIMENLDNNEQLKARGTEYQDARAYAQKQIEALKQTYGNPKEGGILMANGETGITIDKFNAIKQQMWTKSSVFDATKPKFSSDTDYQMGGVAKDMIEAQMPDAAVRDMNSRLGDFASAIKMLEKRQGTVVKGGRTVRWLGLMAGEAMGTTPVGKLVGALTGEKLVELMQDPNTTTKMMQSLLKKVREQPNGDTVIEQAAQVMKQRAETRASRLRLPAPSEIQLPAQMPTGDAMTSTPRPQTPQTPESLIASQKAAGIYNPNAPVEAPAQAPVQKPLPTEAPAVEKPVSVRGGGAMTKKEYIQNFLATKDGMTQVVQKIEKASNAGEAPSEKIIEGIKNSEYFRKEGDIKDSLGDGVLMRNKDGRYVIAGHENIGKLRQNGYKDVVGIDQLAMEYGYDNGYDFLVDQLAGSKEGGGSMNPMRLAEQYLMKNDPNFSHLFKGGAKKSGISPMEAPPF